MMIYLLKMVIVHSYVKSPEGTVAISPKWQVTFLQFSGQRNDSQLWIVEYPWMARGDTPALEKPIWTEHLKQLG